MSDRMDHGGRITPKADFLAHAGQAIHDDWAGSAADAIFVQPNESYIWCSPSGRTPLTHRTSRLSIATADSTILPVMMKRNRVLFLCTGNYYRSRFAEALFNHLARPAKVNWVADSRALNITAGHNVGPISRYAVEGLRDRGIRLPPRVRSPKQVREEDLVSSALTIALDEKEHRPLLELAFPPWAQRVEYWHVHDLDRSPAEHALAEIDRSVRELIARLRRSQDAAA